MYAEPGGCTYVLRLDNTVIAGPDGKRNTQSTQLNDLQLGRPVRFTLLNDRLEPHLCAESADSTFGLNVKRAIVSLLQSTEASSETDVFGTCPQTGGASTDGMFSRFFCCCTNGFREVRTFVLKSAALG